MQGLLTLRVLTPIENSETSRYSKPLQLLLNSSSGSGTASGGTGTAVSSARAERARQTAKALFDQRYHQSLRTEWAHEFSDEEDYSTQYKQLYAESF